MALSLENTVDIIEIMENWMERISAATFYPARTGHQLPNC